MSDSSSDTMREATVIRGSFYRIRLWNARWIRSGRGYSTLSRLPSGHCAWQVPPAGSCVDHAPPLRSPARPDRPDRQRRHPPPGQARAGEGLWPFYWHFIRQERWLVVALFLFGGLIAMLDVTIPAFIGRIVGLVSTHAPGDLLREAWPQLAVMAAVLLLVRPSVFLGHVVLINQIVNPGLSNMIRWQNHWHVVRQSWTFFQNDFAGRIANRVLQTGPSLRESLVMAFDAAWYIVVYGSSALILLASVDWRLTPPILLWFAATPASCGISCHACASARAWSPRCARC